LKKGLNHAIFGILMSQALDGILSVPNLFFGQEKSKVNMKEFPDLLFFLKIFM